MDPHNSFAVAGFFVGENAASKGAMADFRTMGEAAMGGAKPGGWLGADWKGQLDKVTFGWSMDKDLAHKHGCLGEHEEGEVPGSGKHKDYDVCIVSWKAFHNDVAGGYGVNEERKTFDGEAGRAAMKAHVVSMGKAAYKKPSWHDETEL
jgi:hypothetical protein